jgi:tRNA(Ile)-lysidine synthase
MQSFVRNFLTEWRNLKLPFDDKTFIVAVSGGADSVSLLLAINDLKKRKKLNLRFVVAHFNHNLRGGESDEDELFVKNLASKFDFELALGNGEISDKKGNLEQNARLSRYGFLAETAENLNAYAVLTAHTLNDQAETFLFNLLRGSGLDGLGGMKSVRNLRLSIQDSAFRVQNTESDESKIQNPKPKILLIRPLLNWAKREDTENFCNLNEIEFRYDAMNEDLKFNRVRIRKVLLPLLKDFNPKIIETLAQTARLLRDDAEHLAVISQQLTEIQNEVGSEKLNDSALVFDIENRSPKPEAESEYLLLKDLKDIFPAMRRMILRDWLRNKRGNMRGLELKHIEAVEKLIFSRKSGRIVELPGGELVTKKDGKLHFQKTKVEK